jgi:hypothetical protein
MNTRESAPKGAPMTSPARRDHSQDTARLQKELDAVKNEVAALRARQTCRRCALEPPPPERCPGDRRSEDHRPRHTCGLQGWSL